MELLSEFTSVLTVVWRSCDTVPVVLEAPGEHGNVGKLRLMEQMHVFFNDVLRGENVIDVI